MQKNLDKIVNWSKNWLEKKTGYREIKYLSGTKRPPSYYINEKHERAMKAKIDGKEK